MQPYAASRRLQLASRACAVLGSRSAVRPRDLAHPFAHSFPFHPYSSLHQAHWTGGSHCDLEQNIVLWRFAFGLRSSRPPRPSCPHRPCLPATQMDPARGACSGSEVSSPLRPTLRNCAQAIISSCRFSSLQSASRNIEIALKVLRKGSCAQYFPMSLLSVRELGLKRMRTFRRDRISGKGTDTSAHANRFAPRLQIYRILYLYSSERNCKTRYTLRAAYVWASWFSTRELMRPPAHLQCPPVFAFQNASEQKAKQLCELEVQSQMSRCSPSSCILTNKSADEVNRWTPLLPNSQL